MPTSEEVHPLQDGDCQHQKNKIRVKVEGLRNTKGKVRIGLYHHGHEFPSGVEGVYAGKILQIDGNSCEGVFHDIPNGDYALAVLHDENNNETLDRNSFGVPREGFAFSNYSSLFSGVPSYESAKFRIDCEEVKVAVEMHYLY